MKIFKKFTFDSAHSLPNVPDGHKCKNVHGHTYHLTIWVERPLDEKMGWVMDFAELKEIISPVVKELDHKYINDIPGLENPTCEILVKWIWDRVIDDLEGLVKVELNETPTSGAVYKGK
ncbi:MAG: 6-carboxytetrahydropterin synthase QueD [Crocinitomicaceae bacterium]|jgi:6-pyruvoyltetrahydropterin/6-carboxytetrahydropterin synthase|nr:6-carboxytetrahydropterin synthase QueD [Crocinitomicaceae bacterium]MDG1657111.1 6-carboxytetrahydropterin synthase QueD [Crocinitomicaceae bacterium]MDG2440651.1 6-carboxytetrahydropterin synthase QueD [Crocinitomicaceae bacterium]|tara:strand:+ start:8742 stop:9098 length:357 start_codon:yes stop_codon:yes gene_type:complete